ncbi:MAG: RND transporter [Novosphingobium sp.]|nr:RND transporter [Novosphingobium sp.]
MTFSEAASAIRRSCAGITSCLLGPALLSGCSFAPANVRPPLPVPQAYPGENSAGSSVAAIGWRDFFRDDKLRALIAEALANNRDIRIASGRVAEARAAWRIQGSALYPQLDAVATGTRAGTPADLSITGRSETGNQIYAQISAGWEIDFWGRLRNLNDAARAQYLATEEARRAVATELVAQVANGYLLEREYEERMALAQRTITTREESLRIMKRRYEVGSGSKLDMTQAQTLLAQAQMALQVLEQDQAVNRNALALLAGRQVAVAPGPLDLAEASADVALPVGLPSELLVNRPDIVAAEYALRAANANIGAARAAFLPNISLTGAFGTASAELDGLFKDGSLAWNFAPAISMPVFNAGRLAGRLDVAKARQVIAVADYERTVQAAFRDVADSLVRRRQVGLQIETTGRMLAALRERARLAQLRFDNGRSTYLEVLDAQRDLFGTEQTLVQLHRAYLASAVSLYAALGGGFARNIPFATDMQQTGEFPR